MALLYNDSDDEEELNISDEFDATAVFCKKDGNTWSDEEVIIKSRSDIKALFRAYLNNIDAEVVQINLSKYYKIYFSTDSFGSSCIDAKVIDEGNTTHYMFAPLLLVKCDDEVPVKITSDDIETIKNYIDFI